MLIIKHNTEDKAHDAPLNGKDWIIRFEDELSLEMTIRAHRDPSDGYVRRRARAILRSVELDKHFNVMEPEIGVTSDYFLQGGFRPARSVIVRRAK